MAEKKLDLFIEDELTDEFLEEFCCQAHIEKREFDDWHIDRQRVSASQRPPTIH